MNPNITAKAQLDTTAVRAARMMKGLEGLMVPIVVALAFMLASFAVRNSDYWMQIATGRLIAEGKYEFGKDPFSFATAGHYWVNHSWLYDYIVYELHDELHPMIVYIKAGLVAMLAMVMFMAARPHRNQVIVPGSKADPGGWAAAVFVAVGVLAMSSYFTVRSVVVSYLFLAVTFLVLDRSRDWSLRRLCITLGVLFALWANLDAWFFLGPALVALFLVGEGMQSYLPGGEKGEPRRMRQLTLTLGVGLAACLVNPHHVRVFTDIPQELYSNVVPTMENDDAFRSQFMSPWNPLYLNRPELGDSIPGACYAALISVGLTSFVINLNRIRASWLLIFLGSLGLSLLNWRLIPYFAVLSAPIIVLNIRAFFARRPVRELPSEPALTPVASVASGDGIDSSQMSTEFLGEAAVHGNAPPAPAAREAWWPGASEPSPPAASTPLASPSSLARGKDMTMTPESMVAFASVMGRLLTVVLGLFALAMAYPGWLHAAPVQPGYIRCVSWNVEPDPAFKQLAETMRQWHKAKLLPADARGIAFQLDIPSYIAWYAPEIKTFMDWRLSYLGDLSADFMALSRLMTDWKSGVDNSDEWQMLLRRRGVSYLIVRPDIYMLGSEQMFSLWFQNGFTAVFGWNDPEAPRAVDPLKLDVVRLAFGPSALFVPSGATPGMAVTVPPRLNPNRTIFDRFLEAPQLPPPPETEASGTYRLLQQVSQQKATQNAFMAMQYAQLLALGMEDRLLFPSRNLNAMGNIANAMSSTDPDSIATGFLAVRDARRGTQAEPNEGYPYLALGIAYEKLHWISRELMTLEKVAVLHEALERLSPEEIDSNRFVAEAALQEWLSLGDIHAREPIFPESQKRIVASDLAEECYLKALALFDRHPPANKSEEDRERSKKAIQKSLERVQGDLLPARDKFVTDIEHAKQNNRPLVEQVQIALEGGLVREALKLLEDSSEVAEPMAVILLVKLYLSVGRVQAAQEVLTRTFEGAQPKERQKLMQAQVDVWAAAGEFAPAGKAMEEIIGVYQAAEAKDPNLNVRNAALTIGGLFFAPEMVAQSAWLCESGHFVNIIMQVAQLQYYQKVQIAKLLSFRAMLALEEGDMPAAKRFLTELTKLGIPQPDASLLLRIIDQASAKQSQPK